MDRLVAQHRHHARAVEAARQQEEKTEKLRVRNARRYSSGAAEQRSRAESPAAVIHWPSPSPFTPETAINRCAWTLGGRAAVSMDT
jgi:hypothetical protein